MGSLQPLSTGSAPWQEDAHSGDRVAIAPGRARRPGAGRPRADVLVAPRAPAADCPFCAGHEERTPPAALVVPTSGPWRARVVPNAFPALGPPAAQEVVVHGGQHRLRAAELDDADYAAIGEAWARRILDHRAAGRGWVVALLNEGAASGSSLDHTHSQLVALPAAPPRLARECARAAAGHDVLDDADDALIVHRDAELCAFAPRASRSSYELRVARCDHDADPAAEGPLLGRALGLAMRLLGAAAGPVATSLWLHHAPPGTHGPRWHLEALPRLGVLGGMELGVGVLICQTAPGEAAARLREAAAGPAVAGLSRPW